MVAGHRGAVLPRLAPSGATVLPRTATQDRDRGDLSVPSIALSVNESCQHLLKCVLPTGWPNGRSAVNPDTAIGQLRCREVCEAGLDNISCRASACQCGRRLERTMDRLFIGCCGVQRFCLRFIVF